MSEQDQKDVESPTAEPVEVPATDTEKAAEAEAAHEITGEPAAPERPEPTEVAAPEEPRGAQPATTLLVSVT